MRGWRKKGLGIGGVTGFLQQDRPTRANLRLPVDGGQRPLAAGLGVGEVDRQRGGVGLGDLPRWRGGTDTEN
jgi:hypothetical protein